jgi:NAD(P)-dependent dehydrogenase (short-subunit alcohol dehydrogenase family)
MSNSTYKYTVLVTGGTTGLGYEASLALARQLPDHRVIIASRTNKDNADTKINNTLHQQNTIYLPLDLSSSDSIKSFAKTITTTHLPISHLLLNAGLQFLGPARTFSNGLEQTFAINHLGHAHLFYLLLPHLHPTAHITIVASGTHDPAQKTRIPEPHYSTAEDVAHPNPQTANPDGRQRYSTSKLCNVLWTYALDRHVRSSGRQFRVNAFDPGLLPGTNLAREYSAVLRFLWHHVLPRMLPLMRLVISPNIHTAKESGVALARLAIGEEEGVRGVSGRYFEGRREIKSSVMSYDETKQEDLWAWTLKYLAEGEEEKGRWERLEV